MRSMKQLVVTSMMMVLAVLLSTQLGLGYSLIQNGDFAAGGDSWTTDGNVSFDTGYARLYDGGQPYYGTLYQGVSVIPNKFYTYSFEFEAAIDLPDQGGSFSDILATTLYFGSVNDFSKRNDDALKLFDLWGSALPIVENGEISEMANGYSRYFVTFESLDSWVFPTFDFSDLDWSTGGFARVAMVQLEEVQSAVPEPSTLLLSLGGAACLWFVRSRKRS